MERVGVQISKATLKERLQEFDDDNSGTLSRDELVPFFESVSDRPTDAFDDIIAKFGTGGQMTAAEFASFQASYQGEHAEGGESPEQLLARFRASLLRNAQQAEAHADEDDVDPAIAGYRETVSRAAAEHPEARSTGTGAAAAAAASGTSTSSTEGATQTNPLHASKTSGISSYEEGAGPPKSVRRATACVSGGERKRAQAARSAISGGSSTVGLRELMALLTDSESNGIVSHRRLSTVW